MDDLTILGFSTASLMLQGETKTDSIQHSFSKSMIATKVTRYKSAQKNDKSWELQKVPQC
jgi:hypothetical protein